VISTHADWAQIAPLIQQAKQGGRPRTMDVREVLKAIFYVLSTDCDWTVLPQGSATPEHGLRLSGLLD
jgi:putative transposase